MKYTDQIRIMQSVAQVLERKDLVLELRTLRQYSDIAELIGHPKNPNKGLFTKSGEVLCEEERAGFTKFRVGLGVVEKNIKDELNARGVSKQYTELEALLRKEDAEPQDIQSCLEKIKAEVGQSSQQSDAPTPAL